MLAALTNLPGKHKGPTPLDISELPQAPGEPGREAGQQYLLPSLCAVTSPEVMTPSAVSWLERYLGDNGGEDDNDCLYFFAHRKCVDTLLGALHSWSPQILTTTF